MNPTAILRLRASERDLSSLARWRRFAAERFDPASHLIMISLFLFAHVAVSGSLAGGPSGSGLVILGSTLLLLFAGTLAFFFKLRLYDELKDYETDLKLNPTRPLARGLLKHEDLYLGILGCIFVELLAFASAGRSAGPGILGILAAIAYSLLMYHEFFIPKLIRPHLTTYAVSHTVVSGILTVALTSALTGLSPWQLPAQAWAFAANSWCLFNIFEFGRKTFTAAEERPGVDSYSKTFGRLGALLLVLAMALGSRFFLDFLPVSGAPGFTSAENAALGLLTGTGILYVGSNHPRVGVIYRGLSSAYIVLIYAFLIWFS